MNGSDVEQSMENALDSVEYDLTRNIVSNCPFPSLEYLSISKIAISLWKSYFNNLGSKKERISRDGMFFYDFEIRCKIPNLIISKTCEESLKLLVKSIGIEIKDNFLARKLAKWKKFPVYLENLCFNQQGTFNILKTAKKIINEPNLGVMEKYELACDFCLRGKIWDLQEKLMEDDIRNIDNHESFTMQSFWSLFINNEDFTLATNGVETSAYLFHLLMSIPLSDVAVWFIWKNFREESWEDNLIQIASSILNLEGVPNINIILYFAKKMSQDELEEMDDDFHIAVLHKLHAISKWNNLDAFTEYCVGLFKTKNDMNASFSIIWDLWFNCPHDEDLLNTQAVISLWKGFVECFELELKTEIVSFHDHWLYNVGNVEKQGIIAQLIMKVANSEDRMKIMYSQNMMAYCQRLLCEEESQSLNLFLYNILEEKDIAKFKMKFTKVKVIGLCADLIIEQNYDLLDKILTAYVNLSKFKKKYCTDILVSVLKNVEKRQSNPYNKGMIKLLTVIWKYFGWCFNGNKKEMIRYKELVFDLESDCYNDIRKLFFSILQKFVIWGKWKLVKKYWKWILSSYKKYITSPKKKIVLSNIIFKATFGEETSLCEEEKNCRQFHRRFITTCFNQGEVKEIIKELQCGRYLVSNLVNGWIKLQNFCEVEDLLKWTCPSDKNKMDDFKARLMEQFGCNWLFNFVAFNDTIERAKSLLTWLNPLIQAAKHFKENFMAYKSRNYKTILIENLSDEELENEWNMLDKRFYEFDAFLNCYIKEKGYLDKECKNSKKRKVAEEEIFVSEKKGKYSTDE